MVDTSILRDIKVLLKKSSDEGLTTFQEMTRRRRKSEITEKVLELVHREWTRRAPPVEQLQAMAFDSITQATDGCMVRPAAQCSHGANSWLIEMGVI